MGARVAAWVSCYNKAVRSRWQDWVIALCILTLAVTGIFTIWGDSLAGLFGGGDRQTEAGTRREGPATAVPPGPAVGPF